MPQPIKKPSPTALSALTQALGERVLTDPFALATYATDDTPHRCPPAAVVFPRNHDEVVTLVRVANEQRLALVARGAGSGNVGGAVPTPGSVVVSFECMQRVLEFAPDERVIVVESGVRTGEIEAYARTHGLFYPPDPGSSAYSRIGGNIATNAAGAHAVKYGATRDWVLALKAVAGDGRALVTGSRTTKHAVGYDLTRLLVGSEGTLALITEATLRLWPAPIHVTTLRVCYDTAAHACAAVTRVMAERVVPSALEFMDPYAIRAIQRAGAAADLPAGTRALLMVEADGAPNDVERQVQELRAALAGPGLIEICAADDPAEAPALWAARRSLSRAVKQIAPLKINEDVVVPVPALGTLLERIDELARTCRLPIVSFGHAGNGNLHVNFMVHPDDADEMTRARSAVAMLMHTVLDLGGAISGEHGIGSEKRQFVAHEIPAPTLGLMRELKRQFDPNGILNPGKIFPDD